MVDYRKLSPALAGALDDFRDLGRAGLAAHAGDMGLVSIAPAVKPPRVIAFLHCDEEASLAHLAGLGVEVNGGDGPVRTAIVALEAVGPLSEDPAIRLVVPSR
ncbi:MAG: S8 family peptidase, partial [Acidimicrobiales bacterium]